MFIWTMCDVTVGIRLRASPQPIEEAGNEKIGKDPGEDERGPSGGPVES